MKIDEYLALQKKTRGNKYHAKKEEYNGRVYDSIKEARYAKLLDVLRGATPLNERVVSVEPQVRYDIVVNGQKICTYVADFVVTYADHHVEVQDVKSEHTRKLPVFRLKKKLMRAVHGIDIFEVS